MTDSENADDGYVCEVCDKSFETEQALEQHIQEVGLVK